MGNLSSSIASSKPTCGSSSTPSRLSFHPPSKCTLALRYHNSAPRVSSNALEQPKNSGDLSKDLQDKFGLNLIQEPSYLARTHEKKETREL